MTKDKSNKRIPKIVPIPLDNIDIGDWNVRHRDITAGLDDLAASLDKYGQLQPISVFAKKGRFEIVIGQRRYLAAKQLRWSNILAMILPPGISKREAMILSLIENSQRRDLTIKDKEEACKYLLHELGSISAVARIRLLRDHCEEMAAILNCSQQIEGNGN